MKKRVLTLLLSVLLIFSCLPTALADDAPQATEPPQVTDTPQPTGTPVETPQLTEEPQPTEATTPEPTMEPIVEPTAEPTEEPTISINSTDNSPPELIYCIPSKENYSSGEDVVFDLRASDPSGVDPFNTSIVLINTDRSDDFRVTLWDKTDISTPEERQNGIYTYRFNLPVNNYFDTGHYKFFGIWLEDNSGFRVGYGYTIPQITQCNIYVSNTIRTDFIGPEVVSVNVDKTYVSVGESVNFTLKASDPAGISSGYITIRDPHNNYLYKTVGLYQVGDDNSLWQGCFTTDAYTEEGYYTAYTIDICDKLGNMAIRSASGISFFVSNPGYHPGTPTVENITISKDNVKPGDKVTIAAQINPNGASVNYVQLYLNSTSNSMILDCISLEKDAYGLYKYDWTVPPNYQSCTCDLRVCIWQISGLMTQYFGKCNNYVFPMFHISSVFTGLEDRSVLIGSGFDPMAEVSASNESEGDMAGRIEIQGNVNTSQPGLYLLRYRIKADKTINHNGTITPVYYLESRWIGVTEAMPDLGDPNAPLSFTNDSLCIGAQSSEVSVKKDGQSVSFSGLYTVPGMYTVNEKGTNNTQSAGSSVPLGIQSEAIKTQAQSYGQGDEVSAIIDRNGPGFTTVWKKGAMGIDVSINARDISGVAECKYLAGECSIDQLRVGGVVFKSTFTVPKLGKYTVYTRDRLGNENIQVLNINSTSYSGSPYLESINPSAGSLSRAFSKTTTSYKILLSEGEGSITLTPVAEFEGSAIKINGKPGPSYTVNVANGRSVKVTVKVTYGRKTKTYTFTVTRAKSTNNNLGALSASAGAWSQGFDPNVANYTLTLPEGVKSTTIRATAAAGKIASVSPSSKKVTLNNGQSKTVKITVKSQSGARKTYTITVVRAPSSNANLKSLKTNVKGLAPAFSAGNTGYSLTIPPSAKPVVSVTIGAGAAGYKAKVSVNGTGRASGKVALAAGQTVVVPVVVTSQAGNTKEYGITITRP